MKNPWILLAFISFVGLSILGSYLLFRTQSIVVTALAITIVIGVFTYANWPSLRELYKTTKQDRKQ